MALLKRHTPSPTTNTDFAGALFCRSVLCTTDSFYRIQSHGAGSLVFVKEFPFMGRMGVLKWVQGLFQKSNNLVISFPKK